MQLQPSGGRACISTHATTVPTTVAGSQRLEMPMMLFENSGLGSVNWGVCARMLGKEVVAGFWLGAVLFTSDCSRCPCSHK